MPTEGSAESGGHCFLNRKSVELTFALCYDHIVILLVKGQMIDFLPVMPNVAFYQGVFSKWHLSKFNSEIISIQGSGLGKGGSRIKQSNGSSP